MTLSGADPVAVRLCQYSVASGDMFFAELEQRDVVVGQDHAGHIRIWGQHAGDLASARIGLCRIFLEYALYCSSWCNAAESRYHMENFGERLGRGLAAYMKANPDLVTPDDPTIRALEQIFTAIGAEFAEDHLDTGVRFLVSHCPIEEAAKRSGLPHSELGRHGLNALCRRLIYEMNPGWIVVTAKETEPALMFTLTQAVPA